MAYPSVVTLSLGIRRLGRINAGQANRGILTRLLRRSLAFKARTGVHKKSIRTNANARLAAASAATKKPAHTFLIARPQKPTIRQQRRTVGCHNPQSPKDHEIPPKFRGQELMRFY